MHIEVEKYRSKAEGFAEEKREKIKKLRSAMLHLDICQMRVDKELGLKTMDAERSDISKAAQDRWVKSQPEVLIATLKMIKAKAIKKNLEMEIQALDDLYTLNKKSMDMEMQSLTCG
jgi:hypothetical protein